MSKVVIVIAVLLLAHTATAVQINFAPPTHLQREVDLPVVAEEGVEDVAPVISETSGSSTPAIVAESIVSAPTSKPTVEPVSENQKVEEEKKHGHKNGKAEIKQNLIPKLDKPKKAVAAPVKQKQSFQTSNNVNYSKSGKSKSSKKSEEDSSSFSESESSF